MPRPPEVSTRDIADSLTLPPDHQPPPVPPGSVRDWWEWWSGQYGPWAPAGSKQWDDVEAGFYAGFALAMTDIANLGSRLTKGGWPVDQTVLNQWIAEHSPRKR